MRIKSAEFIISNTRVDKCPKTGFPEYAFIGRSNVGKSSLINALTNNKNLAKTSSKPGKTQLINHFLINDKWYLVDLPGYGYAKTSKTQRAKFQKFISNYFQERMELISSFVLVDSRHEPQKIDLEFMEFLAEHQIPFSIVFTKTDKVKQNQLEKNLSKYRKVMKAVGWEELPPIFLTSSQSKKGLDEILGYIDSINDEIASNKS